MKSLTFGVLALLAASGCESFRSGANPELPVFKYRADWSMGVMFERNLVARSREEGEPYERGRPEVDPTHGRVFVGSADHGLYALSANDGSTIWRFETRGFVQCAPLYDPGENVVYFGSNDGALYKIKADRGELVWRFMTNAEVARKPVLSGGILYAANANDTLVAIEPKTGKTVWSIHRPPALGFEVAGYSGPVVAGDLVFMGFSNGTVTAFDTRTGVERWSPVDLSAEAEQLLGDVPQYLDVDTTPVPLELEEGNAIAVGTYAGGVYALEAETGRQLWANAEVLGVSDLSLWSERPHAPEKGAEKAERAQSPLLLASSGTTGLWALDPQTGHVIWRRALPAGGVSEPEPIQGALLVSATQLGVFLLSPVDGSLIDGIHFVDGASAQAAAYGTRAFVLSNGGRFIGLQIAAPSAKPAKSGHVRMSL